MTIYEQMLAERAGREPGVLPEEHWTSPVIEPSAIVLGSERRRRHAGASECAA